MKPTIFVVFAIGLSFLIGKTDAQACTANNPTNGMVDSITPADGASVVYTCTGTYTIVGTTPLTCTAGSLVGGAEPTCAAACTATVTGDLAVSVAAPAHGASTVYSCGGGKTLDGTATQTCNDGTLSGSIPTCGVACTATVTGDLSVTVAAPVHGASTVYSCGGGKILTGTATQTCTDGSLSSTTPTCASAAANSAPVFSPATYSFTATDGTAAGIDVGTVTITDADTDTWTFTITSGDTNSDFAITGNSKVGTIATAKVLDKATTSSYSLTVTLSDATATVTTTVTITFSGASTLVPMLLMTMMCSLYNYV